MRRLYGLLTLFLLPVVWVAFLWLSIKQPGYRQHFSRRLGYNLPPFESDKKQRLWIHAVSVGETLAIAPLVEMLLAKRPDIPVNHLHHADRRRASTTPFWSSGAYYLVSI